MIDSDGLLQRHLPVLKYDSQEHYFADSAAEWTDNPGNLLSRADGTPIASATPAGGESKLELAFLQETSYANSQDVLDTDVIGDPSRSYREQANRLHEDERYRNRIYGRAQVDSHGRTWLQYWFFYFYNDYNLIGSFIHAGRHEGDWEMIQIRLDEAQEPDCAVYAQHNSAEVRRWDQVDRVPGTDQPLVYVARGSHASYFEPGTLWTGYWFDLADGKRRSPALTLEIVREGRPEWRWMEWPGYWGDTRKGYGWLDSGSPRGPCRHDQWDDPSRLVSTADAAAEPRGAARPSLPPAPRVTTSRRGEDLRLLYEAEGGDAAGLPDDALRAAGPEPVGLVVTVNSPDDKAPPSSYAIPIANRTGEVTVPARFDPSKRYDVYVSTATANGLSSESVRCDIDPIDGRRRPGAASIFRMLPRRSRP